MVKPRYTSAVDVQTTVLPGIGLRYDLELQDGRRVGVMAYPSGRREVALYSAEDPDACEALIPLVGSEANAIAEILGAPRIVEHLADMHRSVAGLTTRQIVMPPESPYANTTLGETHARTVTGCSVVAVVRGTTVHASPEPTFQFEPGDVVVAVGTGTAADRLELLLTTGVLGPPKDSD